jgi:hypothetical protein
MVDAMDPLMHTRRRLRCSNVSALICMGLAGLTFAALCPPCAAEEFLPASTLASIQALAESPEVVAAVRAENANGKTDDQIAILDEGWQEMYRQPGFLAPWTDSPCGQLLRTALADRPAFTRAVVLDRDGTNVALSDEVPRYWHRDASCFENAIAGQSHVQAKTDTLVEVCVPVHGAGAVPIGVMWIVVDRQLLAHHEHQAETTQTAGTLPAVGLMVP